MSRARFVDTGAWKAFVDAKDEFHRPVREAFEQCRREKVVLETSDYVVAETLTLLRPGLGHRIAVQFGQMVQSSQVIQITFTSAEVFQRAWDIFQRYADKDFSFVDCASFALMEKQGLREALTVDPHFVQYGWSCRP